MKASGTQTPFLVLCPMHVIKQSIFYQRLNLYVMMKFKLFFIVLFCSLSLSAFSQLTYGTTGLLHAPSAEMQRDKTFMVGGNFLNKELTPPTWYYHTYNYFLSVTVFPFLEIAYTCTLFKAEALGLKPYGYSGFTNQDRYFSARLRVLKEGQFWKYMPAVVLGTSDPFTSSGGGKSAPRKVTDITAVSTLPPPSIYPLWVKRRLVSIFPTFTTTARSTS